MDEEIEYKMQKMMVEDSIKEEEHEDEEDDFLNSISLEEMKQKYYELREYTTSKEQEVLVLQSIIENKDEQIEK